MTDGDAARDYHARRAETERARAAAAAEGDCRCAHAELAVLHQAAAESGRSRLWVVRDD